MSRKLSWLTASKHVSIVSGIAGESWVLARWLAFLAGQQYTSRDPAVQLQQAAAAAAAAAGAPGTCVGRQRLQHADAYFQQPGPGVNNLSVPVPPALGKPLHPARDGRYCCPEPGGKARGGGGAAAWCYCPPSRCLCRWVGNLAVSIASMLHVEGCCRSLQGRTGKRTAPVLGSTSVAAGALHAAVAACGRCPVWRQAACANVEAASQAGHRRQNRQ